MADAKTDLRIIKTKASIKREFLALLQKKPVEKITVTELAEAALINKGTFYLHYSDIYDLYEETIRDEIVRFCSGIDFYADFFSAPEQFAAQMLDELKKAPWETTFPHTEPLSTKVPVPALLTEELKKRLYSYGVLPPSVENDIKLEYVLNGIFIICYEHGREHQQEVITTISESIKVLFPAVP